MIACKMAASGKVQVLSLYRMLLRESEKFSAYNYRTYALRRVKDAFKENKNVEDPQNLQRLLSQAWDSLALIQRQVTLGKMYKTQKTVVETGFKKTL